MSYGIYGLGHEFDTEEDAIEHLHSNVVDIANYSGDTFIYSTESDLVRPFSINDDDYSVEFPYGDELMYADHHGDQGYYYRSQDRSINEWQNVLDDAEADYYAGNPDLIDESGYDDSDLEDWDPNIL